MKRTPYNPSRFDGGKTMIKAVLQTATFLGAISCFGLVNATETRTPLVPLPSVVDFTDGERVTTFFSGQVRPLGGEHWPGMPG
jgi:hypothetical protein